MTIALIAHDNKKADMVAFVSKRLPFFNGPLGGDAQIAALAVEGQIDLVIFLRDPLGKHPHDVDISMLMRLCDVHDIPLATNYRTASYLVKYFKSKK